MTIDKKDMASMMWAYQQFSCTGLSHQVHIFAWTNQPRQT